MKACNACGLVDTLSRGGPFTVFAPTDEAFGKLPKGTLDGLLKDTAKLKAIILYHAVSGEVKSSDISGKMSVKMVNGKAVTVEAAEGVVKVNDAKVIKADIAADNGVIHVIDRVILPPS
mgnify:CR=1 FL=1